jgi:hypothetical protein
MNLKSLIEEDALIIQDYDTINELSSFVSKGIKFEAESGRNDDLVDTLIMFAWMTTDSYFQELSNMDTRKAIYEERIRRMEEEMLPFGFIDTGVEVNTFVDDEGQQWKIENM